MSAKEIKTEAEFEAAAAGGGAFVLFYSPWCPFCSSFLPAYEELGGSGRRCFKLDTSCLPGLEDRFSVEVVPTVLFFSGGRLSARLDGVLGRGLSAAELRKFAEAHGGGKR